VVVRKIGVPWDPELAMGAIAGSDLVLDRPLIRELGISEEEVNAVIKRERAGMENREDFFRSSLPALDLTGRPVILADDGLATGSTMLAAIRHVRSLKPSKLIVAVPVGSDPACERIRGVADDLVCAVVPPQFMSVGQWYRDFRQTEDTEVRELIAENRRHNLCPVRG
jgi:predicted phosphoribosyltransferase